MRAKLCQSLLEIRMRCGGAGALFWVVLFSELAATHLLDPVALESSGAARDFAQSNGLEVQTGLSPAQLQALEGRLQAWASQQVALPSAHRVRAKNLRRRVAHLSCSLVPIEAADA